MDFNWSNVPSSILVEILGFLNLDDLKMASTVCKHWLLASAEPVLLAKMVVHIYNTEDRTRFNYSHTKIASGLRLFGSSSRDFSRFCLHNLKLDQKNAENATLFLNRNVANITHLTIKNSQIGSKTLAKILKIAKKLESLEFYDMEMRKLNRWRQEDFVELQGQLTLRHLCWHEALIISDNIFKLLVGLLKPGTLQSLVLGDYDVEDAAGQIKSYCCKGDGLLELDTFANFLRTNQSNLRSLVIDDTLQERAMKALVQTQTELPGLKLERLALRKFLNMGRPHELTSFFERLQPSLKELLLFAVTADNRTMKAMVAQKNVEVLQIIQLASQRMDHEAIALLPNFVNLKSLSLHHFDNVSTKEFLVGFSAIKLEALENLELHAFSNLHYSCLLSLLPRLRNLKGLIILDCNSLVNNEVLRVIHKDMKRLETFHLTQNKEITDAGFLKGPKTIANLDRLQNFSIRGCSKLTDRCLKSIKLLGLKEIFIEECPLITARGIKAVFDQCPGLQAIKIWGGNLTAVDAVRISEYAKSTLKRLKTIDCDVKSESERMSGIFQGISGMSI